MSPDVQIVNELMAGTALPANIVVPDIYNPGTAKEIFALWGIEMKGPHDANRRFLRVQYPEGWTVRWSGEFLSPYVVQDEKGQARLHIPNYSPFTESTMEILCPFYLREGVADSHTVILELHSHRGELDRCVISVGQHTDLVAAQAAKQELMRHVAEILLLRNLPNYNDPTKYW